MLAAANLQSFCLILGTEIYLLITHSLHIKIVLCSNAAVKKQTVDIEVLGIGVAGRGRDQIELN